MRLLEYTNDGEVNLREFLEDDIPRRYVILSHRWEAEEVTFKTLMDGTGEKMAGYKKIQFCVEQARRDGLQYCWVDTCCIDKSNAVELAEAINSMFRWYRDATKCYVYLSDVSRSRTDLANKSNKPWEAAFRKSKWFTRGWTLQELIAPALVEFFSKEGELLGNKTSLERQICEVTGIPHKALQGGSLSDFSITERMAWAATRETTRKEDMAYSLLGIFNVNMSLIYGEGKEKAFTRLREEIEKASKGTKREDFAVSFSLSSVSHIEHFVAREAELTELHARLLSDGSRRTVVLHGLGGIGKTQLSVVYAKRHRESYSAVFWLNIKDDDALKQSFARIARQISREHPLASRLSNIDTSENLDEVVDAVKAWLSLPDNTRWLMIYDNYDNPRLPGNTDPAAVDIRQFLPESYQGSIIITTRSSQVRFGHSIRLRKLKNVRDSLEILSNASRRTGLISDSDAIKLAEKLDGLPLALATAGAYLDRTAISFSDDLRLYEESWAKLQKMSPKLSSYEDRTLYSTWQISFAHVERRNGLAAKLLRLWAYFDNQDLWFELLKHCDSKDPEWIRELTEDEISFHNIVRVLSDHGLVEVDSSSQELTESRGYSIHGCLHSWTIHVLNQDLDYDLAKMAVKLVGSHVPVEQTALQWLTQQRLLRHAARCYHIILGSFNDDGMAWTCHRIGLLFADRGKLAEATAMYHRALQGREKMLGLDHILTLDTVNNLGNLYRDQSKLAQAESLLQRALRGYEKALGAEHLSTLGTVNNLGNLYWNQGKLSQAEEMYQRGLQGYEKALGTEHISTLTTVGNLGILYKAQNKLSQAEVMYQRALHGKEKALGEEHTSTLEAINNLGTLYLVQDKMVQAESMFQRALQGCQKVLGPEHVLTLAAISNLGRIYYSQAKLAQAEDMYEQAWKGYVIALGAEHMSALMILNSLGAIYMSQDKLAQAEDAFQQALRGYEKTLGAENLSTLNPVHNLGVLYLAQSKLGEAEEMFQRALKGRDEGLGPEHRDTLATVQNLGLLYKNQGKLAQAESMYQRALEGFQKALGPEHTSTLHLVDNLGSLYKDQGKLVEAEEKYQRALQGREKTLGLEQTSTIDTVTNLGSLYLAQGKLSQAESMYQQALQGYEKGLGSEHTSTLLIISNLGFLYRKQGKLAESEEMFERALQGREQVLGLQHTTTLGTVSILGSVYADQGKLSQAEDMYQRALQGYKKLFGPEHTSSLLIINNLGFLYQKQCRLAEAEQMYQQALQGQEKTFGVEHMSTLDTIYNLAILYKDQGKLIEAESMYERVLQGYEKTLGAEHTSTLDTVCNLGNLYKTQGKLDEAETMYLRALQIYKNTLNLDCLSAVNTLYSLYEIYRRRVFSVRQELRVQHWMNPGFVKRKQEGGDTIVAVASFCEKFGSVWPSIISVYGRMLIWAGRDVDAISTFQNQSRVADSNPSDQSGTTCDGCGRRLSADMERFVCRACVDVDICNKCYEIYDIDGILPNSAENCQAHLFLAIPRQEKGTSDLGFQSSR